MAELLEAAGGWLPGPNIGLPKEIEGAADADEPKELLTLALTDPERQLPRRWSMWKQYCPVSLCDNRLLAGSKEFAVEYAGRVFTLANLDCQRRFCAWPTPFLTEAPRINAPGMALGFAMLSPYNYRLHELAGRLREQYGFDIVDIPAMIAKAMQGPDADPKPPPPPPAADGETAQEEVTPAPPEEDFDGPRLFAAEKAAVNAGKELSADTILRLVGSALCIEENIQTVQEQDAQIAKFKQELEAAAEAEQEPPEHIEVNDEGEPVVELSRPMLSPMKGFILLGFPESAEQYQMLQKYLQLVFEKIIILKKVDDEEEAPEVVEVLTKEGFDVAAPMDLTLESYNANVDELVALDGIEVVEIPLSGDGQQQFVQIRKAIDPFYPIVEDPSSAADIPDPDSFDAEEANAAAAANAEEGEEVEPIDPPVIPWSLCGSYCPVTLAEDRWLYPGSKEYQCVYEDKVFALGSESCHKSFLAEPVKYVPDKEPILPPPRVLITGPSGSGVGRQCQLLASAYGVPILQLEDAWRKEVAQRLEKQRAKVKADAAAERLREDPMLTDEGGPAWPEDWIPPPEKNEDEEAEAEEEQAEPEPEDDGLDDEGREALFIDAMRSVLGSHCGACVIDGTWFGDLDDEELSDDMRSARSLQNLLVKARRLPDLIMTIRCKHDTAVQAMLDLEAIDAAHAARVAEYNQLVEEAEANEEDPPEQPEDLIIDEEEKESDRARAKFVERKKQEQDLLKELVEAITEARAEVRKIPADRGEAPCHQAIRWHCRPFLEQRMSLLARQQVLKVRPSRATDLLQRTLARPSKFGEASPVNIDAPLFAGRKDALVNGVEFRGRIYYFRTAEELEKFIAEPLNYIHGPAPSPTLVHPAVAVTGPPLAGKTTLVQKLGEELGAVVVSLPEVITRICDMPDLPESLQEVRSSMRQGQALTDELLAKVLQHRLSEPDVASKGWIFDDFPHTVEQAKALNELGILPHRLLVLETPEDVCISRLMERSRAISDDAPDLHLYQVDLQKARFTSYASRSPDMRSYYREVFGNEVVLDGIRSTWAVFDQACQESKGAVSSRMRYFRRTAEGKACSIFGMSFTKEYLELRRSPWGNYCPVRLTLGNELVVSQDERLVVEYNSQIFWLSSAEKMDMFLEDPEAFLQVPLPTSLPRVIDENDTSRTSVKALESYCPVALVDRKELVKVEDDMYVAQYQAQYWTFTSQEALDKFMLRPARYAVPRTRLPAKKPPIKGEQSPSLLDRIAKGKDLEPTEILTYMQSSVAEAVCQALVETGERRPLYPGKSPEESILLFMGKFLRARNPANAEMYGKTVCEDYDRFLTDCALPEQVKELMVAKQAESENAEAQWTTSNERAYWDQCARFDEVFGLQFG
eukprot:CAMPEP_0178443130 /NCGR_PEP_ID=MMETSP0689_2-20121128/38670_1 /TAXON_ID=160604 /ORGANISM="Amphidinium massartii, Strain CS-259" /LENGTH=1376 /DNA_ID=CAMNT_0020066995 /DNA_START=32 /DNA_END=4162 /DNA_ORIENTATION=-